MARRVWYRHSEGSTRSVGDLVCETSLMVTVNTDNGFVIFPTIQKGRSWDYLPMIPLSGISEETRQAMAREHLF